MNISEWLPIPAYEGVYWINQEGAIKNSRGTILKRLPYAPNKVRLRKDGTLEEYAVSDIISSVFGGTK